MRRLIALAPLVLALGCADRSDMADTAAAGASAAGTTALEQPAAGGSVQQGLIDPNTATREQLAALQIDSTTASTLIAGRPYSDMVAVDRVLAARVDSAGRRTLYARLFKPLDLNTAKPEEILLIPGVGQRMLHEFEEYRPYRNMEQFRREIGKYVDKSEVARLEQYVTIK